MDDDDGYKQWHILCTKSISLTFEKTPAALINNTTVEVILSFMILYLLLQYLLSTLWLWLVGSCQGQLSCFSLGVSSWSQMNNTIHSSDSTLTVRLNW